MLSLARSIGALPRVAHAMEVLGRIAASRNDHGAALRWLGDALVAGRSVGDRRVEAMVLAWQGISHLESGDASAALRHLQQAQEPHQALGDPAAAGDAVALAALCELRLGRPEHALSAVNRMLERLQLDALGDARAER